MDGRIDCPGCGDRVEIPTPRVATPMLERDQVNDEAPGRVTIHYGSAVIHRCAHGAFLPPDQIAPSKPD